MLLDKLNEVLASRKSFISDRLNFSSQAVALLVNIIHWAILWLKIKPDEAYVVLHYNVIYGVDLVDRAAFIYMIPAAALLVLILNFLASNYFFKREKLAGYFLNAAGIAVQLIFFAATLTLIVINER